MLLVVLEALAAQEAKITEALYPLFFERRPAAQPLLGLHALAEREEMIRETLRSLLALADGEGIQAQDSALSLIARASHGSFRDAVSTLDQQAA